VKKLIEEDGIDVNCHYGNDLYTPLHMAVFCANKELVMYLLDHHADVNRRDDHGDTPLHLATSIERAYIAKILIEHGADATLKNVDNVVPRVWHLL